MVHSWTLNASSSISTLRDYAALLIPWSTTVDKIATFWTKFIIKVNIFWLWWFRSAFRVHVHFLEKWLLWKSVLHCLGLYSNHVWAKRFFHTRNNRTLISLHKAYRLTASCLWWASLPWPTNNIEPWVPKRGKYWLYLIPPCWLDIGGRRNCLSRGDGWKQMLLKVVYNIIGVYINFYHSFDFILGNIILVFELMKILNLLLHVSIELLLDSHSF